VFSARFPNSFPIWRSVAAAIGFQQTPDFARLNVRDGDHVVVIDADSPSLAVSLLVARKDRELAARLPETSGIYFEHNPALPYDEELDNFGWRHVLAGYAEGLVRSALARRPRCQLDEGQIAAIARTSRSRASRRTCST
jgi:hypothetical protein